MNPDRSRARILVVDDDAAIVDMLDILLRLEGFQVRTLTDPSRALETITGWHPQVVLLDIMMPGLDGRDLARQIRSLDDTDGVGIGIVFHSALASDDDTWAAWQAGADSYITKPSDLEQVVAEVLRVLAARLDQRIDIPEIVTATRPAENDL